MADTLLDRLESRMRLMRASGLGRRARVVETTDSRYVRLAKRCLLNFASNDYLGLAMCEDWRRTVREGFVYAPSGTASRLVTGHCAEIERAEQAYADFFGYETCLFFPSGYQANLALITGLLHSGDEVFFDRHVHASMARALPWCRARLHGYAHNALESLNKKLSSSVDAQPVILTESVFSMDGIQTDMQVLGTIKRRHEAFVMLDEAHSVGILGSHGQGIGLGVADCTMGTFGKALGFFGAFALMPRSIRDALENLASAVLHSTSLPEAHAVCARALLDRIEGMDAERAHVATLAQYFREKLTEQGLVGLGQSHIVSIEVGDENRSTALADALQEQGIFALAARHPTVAQGHALLRFSLTAAHDFTDIDRCVEALCKVMKCV